MLSVYSYRKYTFFWNSSDGIISNYFLWTEAETGAVTEEEEQQLRQFDLDCRFGPCTGNTPQHVHPGEYLVKVELILSHSLEYWEVEETPSCLPTTAVWIVVIK